MTAVASSIQHTKHVNHPVYLIHQHHHKGCIPNILVAEIITEVPNFLVFSEIAELAHNPSTHRWIWEEDDSLIDVKRMIPYDKIELVERYSADQFAKHWSDMIEDHAK
jgi:hypothetical protein